MTKTYAIQGMSCAACVQKVADALNELATKVEVTLYPPRVTLNEKEGIPFESLAASVAKAGKYKLVPLAGESVVLQEPEEETTWLQAYYPLFLIVGLIAIVSLRGAQSISEWMLHFMAGFFIVFCFFKLLDLQGFRDAYSAYDLLARRWPSYGLVYPFLELGIGFAFLFQIQLNAALAFSVLLMGFSSLGVIKALTEKRKIRCACLGTVLKLPMSSITLIEDLGMVAMSAAMLAG